MIAYKYLPHTADVKFEAFGITLRDLFRNSALAMCNAMYESESVQEKESVKIELQAQSLEQLLHKFLEEILFQIDTKQMLFREFRLIIDEKQNKLQAELVGEAIDAEKHTIKTIVKGVSWHQFELEKTAQGWKATVVVDV